MGNKMNDKYKPEGGEFQICHNCDSHWYDDAESDVNWGAVEDNEDGDSRCPACGAFLWECDNTGTDPGESTVKEWFKEIYNPSSDDEVMANEAYNNYTDLLCKDGIISELMYNNMSAYFE